MRRLKIGLIACSLLILLGALAYILRAAEQPASPTETLEIQMTAKKYEFNPHVVTVKKGAQVKLIVTALDRDHGFKLEAFGIDQKVKKGEPTTIEFTADKAGTFPFKCSNFCGFGHGRMKGELVVEEAANP